VKLSPAKVSTPLRGLVVVLAVTDQVTGPLPLPVTGVQVSQLESLVVAIQRQPATEVTFTLPLPLLAPTEALLAEST
jgi:hypothetical protein